MGNEGLETIALAVGSLEGGVARLWKRSGHEPDDKSLRRIQRLLKHARHILTELLQKRCTLKAFLSWFRQEWIRIEIHLEKYPVEILQHSMQHFLRCQDAFILLTSGECRHKYDLRLAKKSKFPSRLASLQERDDGYTVLYKDTGVYSGYGFDEFNNEIVGVRALLAKELKRYHKSPWDFLERHGGTELLESLLDEHERETKELQHSLQSIKRLMIENITKRLKPKNLKFATQDKMERLSLSIQGRTIDLERRADSFQIEGPLLPNKHSRPLDWNFLSFKVQNEVSDIQPPAKNPKRRRVIVDSDSDDNVDTVIATSGKDVGTKVKDQSKGKSSGLVVRVDSSSIQAEKEDSLAVIKTQVGVNIHDLEYSREILEGENTRARNVLEDEKVVRLENIVNRALARTEIDENEVWDARECLRYACMESGNKYLWDPSLRCTEKAIEHFEKAKSIVEVQQKSQERVAGAESSVFIKLNLLYLHTQASVNIGISLVDTSHQKLTVPKVKIHRAIEEFKMAKETMAKLRSLARIALTAGTGTVNLEATSYILKSKELESLACRWMGRGLWLLTEEAKSVDSFECASRLFQDELLESLEESTYFEMEILGIAAEAIFATSDLADRCYRKMSEIDVQSSSSRQRGDKLLAIMNRSLHRHIAINKSVERYLCQAKLTTFRSEYGITTSKDVESYRNDVIAWWEERSRTETVSIGRSKENNLNQRSDTMSSSECAFVHQRPPVSDVMNCSFDFESKRYRKKRKERSLRTIGRVLENTTQQDAIEAFASHDSSNLELHRPIRFRRWGDDLVHCEREHANTKSKDVDSSNKEYSPGKTLSSILTYPSVAPRMAIESDIDTNG